MANEQKKSQLTQSKDYTMKELQKEALDKTAAAVKTIDLYHEESVLHDYDYQGNIEDAKTYAGATMVHLAASAGKDDDKKVKDILSGYGLENLI